MQQQMAGLVHHQATGPSPRLRAAHGMVSFSPGANARHHVAVHAGRARLGRVTAAAARPKYCWLRGAAAVAAPAGAGPCCWSEADLSIWRALAGTIPLLRREPPADYLFPVPDNARLLGSGGTS